MAINKRKILQSAQKHLQKGALEKALKDYQTLLKADPKDANLRLKIGDIELKRGRTDEAVTAYLKVAEAFMNDGFDAKAVALYKQITKIDEKRADVLVPLADLYQRMGLQSDAMAALQTAADAHYRDGQKDEALDLLRRMAALDPSNTNSRLKVADLLRQEERNEEAISEYEEVAAELERQGDEEDRIRVLVRVLELAPDRIDLLASVARSRIDSGKFEAAEKTAKLMIEQQSDEPDAWLLLGEASAALGKGPEGVEAYRRAAEIHRERGNDDVARDITQRFVAPARVDDPGAGDAADDDLLGAAVEDLSGPAATPDFDPNSMSLGSPLGESAEDHTDEGGASLPPLPQVEDSGVEAVPEVDGDPEQLLAEASVYLRYGKHDRAIDSLRAIVRQDPACVAAFSKLGEALEATGQTEHAITAYERGAQAASASGELQAFEALRQSVAALDAERAEALQPPGAGSASQAEPANDESDDFDAASLDEAEAGIEFDVDVELGDSEETPASGVASETPADEIEIDLSLDVEEDGAVSDDEVVPEFDLSGEVEIAVEDELEAPIVEVESSEAPEEALPELTAAEESLMEVSVEGADSLGIEISDPALDLAFEDDEAAMPEADAFEESQGEASLEIPDEASGASASATTPAQMAEDLEEADFFFQQGMMDEARIVYERILAIAPSHPGALLRVGEIEAASDGVVDSAADAGLDSDTDEASLVDEESADLVDLDDDEIFTDEDDSSEGAKAEEELGGDPDDDTGRIQQTPVGELEPELVDPHPPEHDEAMAAPEDAAPVSPMEAEITAPVMPAPISDQDDGFDLAAQLSDAFDLDDSADVGAPLSADTEGEGFEEVFAAFKQGVEGALEDGDFEAHYDLGIAYKEMGLFEDAIGEFRLAMGSDERQLPCLHMMGLCAMDLGRIVDAVAHLEQALGLPGIPEEQQIGLRFDLGRAYVGVGDMPRARTAFETVQALDAEFPEVEERLAALDELPETDAVEGENRDAAFENFDDLMADDSAALQEAEDEAPEEPAYESFDDFLEDESSGVAEESDDEPEASGDALAPDVGSSDVEEAADAPPGEPLGPEPDPLVETPSGPEPPKKPGRRKKKISFV